MWATCSRCPNLPKYAHRKAEEFATEPFQQESKLTGTTAIPAACDRRRNNNSSARPTSEVAGGPRQFSESCFRNYVDGQGENEYTIIHVCGSPWPQEALPGQRPESHPRKDILDLNRGGESLSPSAAPLYRAVQPLTGKTATRAPTGSPQSFCNRNRPIGETIFFTVTTDAVSPTRNLPAPRVNSWMTFPDHSRRITPYGHHADGHGKPTARVI